jgi:oxygen-independent coproporphyrinogen III oxidase
MNIEQNDIIISNAKELLNKLNLKPLDKLGLGRWEEEYYLVSLYHPLRYMQNSCDNINKIDFNKINEDVDIYIHVPFCHINCSFCHFYKEIIPTNKENTLEDDYINALLREIKIYSSKINKRIKANSIQFGGGTPSALSIQGLEKLLIGLKESLDLKDCNEIKFEFHPSMYLNLNDYRSKLKVLKEFGLTTAIIDIEATDKKVLKSIKRQNTSIEGYVELIKIAKEEGIKNIASAFMTGLPYETLTSYVDTLKFLSSIEELDAINIYPLMFKPSDPVFLQRRQNPEIFATPQEKDLMMILSEQILSKAGYKEGPTHFFTKNTHTPIQQIAKSESKTLLGLGPASFGYLDFNDKGLQYMNYPDLNKYIQAVNNDNLGQWKSSCLNKNQKAIRKVFFALNSFEPVEQELMHCANKGIDDDRFIKVLNTLKQLNLIEKNNDSIYLTKKGQLRNSEIINYLSEPNVLKWNTEDPEYDLIRRYEFFPYVSLDNELLFNKYHNIVNK